MDKQQNFLKRKKVWYMIIIFLVILISATGVYWMLYLHKAHSTFVEYYKFRGCTQLLEKTDDYGICKIEDGSAIKIVKYQNKWYLDGDLPCGFGCFK